MGLILLNEFNKKPNCYILLCHVQQASGINQHEPALPANTSRASMQTCVGSQSYRGTQTSRRSQSPAGTQTRTGTQAGR